MLPNRFLTVLAAISPVTANATSQSDNATAVMPEEKDARMSPSLVDEKPASGIDPVEYPIYCLTDLTSAERKNYQEAIKTSTDVDWHFPRFESWTGDHDGNLQDMYQTWRETGGEESIYHFAFFMDRIGVTNTTIIAAQPDAYTLLSSPEASDWVLNNLTSYLNHLDPLGDTSQ